MSQVDKQLEAMRNNPRDWRIETLISLAVKYGIEIRNHGGSHHIFSSPGIELAISVPAHRPIKPVYIRQFVSLVDQVKGKQS
ncbi:MAG: type II toxin-antitoxin system HicA family toxin [Desulfobacteraceae bacterium]|nr:type II toxin-antitoxin system HicA family toxin [Desulfobacteraceae bacterium]